MKEDQSNDVLRRWESSNVEDSKNASDAIKKMGKEALPILRKVLSTNSPKWSDACGMILAMDETAASEVVLPLTEREDLLLSILFGIEVAESALPWLWPALTKALGSVDRRSLLRALDSVQAQITEAKIEEIDLSGWGTEMRDRLIPLAGSHDPFVSCKAAEIVVRLPLIDGGIAHALEGAIRALLDKRETGLCYLTRAWMIQEIAEDRKVELLGEILRRAIYLHDRYVAAVCCGDLGAAGKELVPECLSILEEMISGPSRGTSQQVNRLRHVLDRLESVLGAVSAKHAAKVDNPRLVQWMEGLESREFYFSSSRHEAGSIAREQIRRCRDESLVAPVLRALANKPSLGRYQNLVKVVDSLLKNTGSPELREWLTRECNRDNLKPKQIEALLYVSQPEVLSLARRAIFMKNGAFSSQCLDQLKKDPSDEDVDLMCEAGRQYPSLRLLVIFALEEAGSKHAVPFLLELAKRKLESKKQEELEWRAYSILALGKLGDSSVVSELCELLENSWPSGAIIRALAELGDVRGVQPAVTTVRGILPKLNASRSWSPGHRTPVYNIFQLAWKCGALEMPEVRSLAEEIGRPEIWNKLLPEEVAFLSEIGCAPRRIRPTESG